MRGLSRMRAYNPRPCTRTTRSTPLWTVSVPLGAAPNSLRNEASCEKDAEISASER